MAICGFPSSAYAESSAIVPEPNKSPQFAPPNQAASPADGATATLYENLRQVWENCNRIKSTSIDVLSEGRNAPARRKWLDYDVSTLRDDLDGLKTYSSKITLPSSVSTAATSSWQTIQSKIARLDELVVSLANDVQTVKSPTDDSYPPHFWKPATELSRAAAELDSSLLGIFSLLNASLDQASQPAGSLAASAQAAQNETALVSGSGSSLKGYASAVAAETGIKQLDESTKRVSKACWGLFGELERWNLLYGQPPAGGIGDMFYGGGLTKEEVLSQYKYLPQFTFTNAPYVMLYSYRLPPRQNMLAYYTGNIGKLLNLIEADMNNMQFPADRKLAVAGPWEDSKKLFIDCRTKYLSLYNAVNNTSDERLKKNIREDQVALGQPVMDIYADMAKLRDALSDLNKLVQ
jgi:hypothetical protein